MATNSQWTVIFEDRKIIKNNGSEKGTAYTIDDDSFWSNGSFSNIWAIQSGASSVSDEVEHRDATPHNSLADEGINIQQFIDKWDEAHLTKLQFDWDNDNAVDETEAEKIARLGARPTSYSS